MFGSLSYQKCNLWDLSPPIIMTAEQLLQLRIKNFPTLPFSDTEIRESKETVRGARHQFKLKQFVIGFEEDNGEYVWYLQLFTGERWETCSFIHWDEGERWERVLDDYRKQYPNSFFRVVQYDGGLHTAHNVDKFIARFPQHSTGPINKNVTN